MPNDVPRQNSGYPENQQTAVADEVAAEADGGNIFSRMYSGYEDAVYGASAGVYNWFVDDENEITGDDVRAADQRLTAQTGEILTDIGTDIMDTNALLLRGEFAEYGTRVGHNAVSLVDGVVDGAFGVGALGATTVDAVINNAPRLVGRGPAFGEDHSSWNTFDEVNSWDDAGLGWAYDKAGYELQTGGLNDALNFGGSFIGGGGVFSKGASWTARGARSMGGGFRKAATETVEKAGKTGAKNAGASGGNATREATEKTAETATRRVFTVGNGTARASTKQAAEETAEAGAKKAAKEGVEEAAEATGKKSFAGRAMDVMAGRSPKGIYRNKNYSVSDKLTELSRADELGMDPGKAKKFTDRLINDVGAGRATIKPSEIRNLERSGDFSEDLMKNLRSAQMSSQTAVGRLDYKAHHLGDTFRNAVGGSEAIGVASTVAFAPVKLALNSLTSLKGAFIGAAAYGGDEFLLDGALREGYGNAYGATVRGVSNVFEFAAGDNEASRSLDIAAATVDPDQTVGGTLRDQGRHGTAFAAESVLGAGEHTTVGADAVAVNADGEEMVNASDTGPAARNGDGETSIMDSFSNAAEGMGIDFNNMDMVNYAQIALGVMATYTAAIEGNMLGGAIMGAMAFGLRPAMKILDDWAESNGIDLVPDQWHTPESNNAYAGLGL